MMSLRHILLLLALAALLIAGFCGGLLWYAYTKGREIQHNQFIAALTEAANPDSGTPGSLWLEVPTGMSPDEVAHAILNIVDKPFENPSIFEALRSAVARELNQCGGIDKWHSATREERCTWESTPNGALLMEAMTRLVQLYEGEAMDIGSTCPLFPYFPAEMENYRFLHFLDPEEAALSHFSRYNQSHADFYEECLAYWARMEADAVGELEE